jgi:UDP-2-acetamido-2,6-beta-L-arabino-hexul-4-ose reductase
MKSILVTGSQGFIGQNLVQALKRRGNYRIFEFDINDSLDFLAEAVRQVDIIFHLAGINRPEKIEEYESGNVSFTKRLMSILEEAKVRPVIVFSSSIQARLGNPYGQSKRRAEEVLIDWAERNDGTVAIFRLPNVFGKWCRPNYNSAIATFCHNIARGLDINITDPERVLELVYIDDVVNKFLSMIENPPARGAGFYEVEPVFKIKLATVVELIRSFKDSRQSLVLPDFSDLFIKRLYATYLSYLPENEFSYRPEIKIDNRGQLAELLKSPYSGQIFISRTKPGITRGNHYHDTKTEKFIVIDGEAIIRFRHIKRGDVIEYRISGNDLQIVDIPPGYTHSIENVGDKELIVLFWASEIFDPQKPDTYPLEVKNEKNISFNS